jgi:hypothetical protein
MRIDYKSMPTEIRVNREESREKPFSRTHGERDLNQSSERNIKPELSHQLYKGEKARNQVL